MHYLLLRSFIDWLVATHIRSITILCKLLIYCLKFLNPGLAETVKNFRRWTHNFSNFSKCFNHFPTNARTSFSFFVAKSVYPVSLWLQNKSAHRKHAKHKRHQVAKFKSNFDFVSKIHNWEVRKRNYGVPKTLTAL